MVLKYLSIFCVSVSLLMVQGWQQVQSNSLDQIQYVLPKLTHTAFVNAYNLEGYATAISDRLSQSLNIVTSASNFSLIDHIQVSNFQLKQIDINTVSNANVTWHDGQSRFEAKYDLGVHYSYIYLLLVSLLLSVIIFVFERYVLPISWTRKAYYLFNLRQFNHSLIAKKPEYAHLKQAFLSFQLKNDELFASITEDPRFQPLTELQTKWLVCALYNQHDLDKAFEIAQHPDLMVFNPSEQTVTIHGLPITLAKTPLIYFSWYALRQMDALPAYINPAPNKPDIENGQMLAELMIGYQGHKKAINELQEKGLRCKTLDQNRNKIKSELIKVLGELASSYLIQGERDLKTARYKYALPVAKRFIRIVI